MHEHDIGTSSLGTVSTAAFPVEVPVASPHGSATLSELFATGPIVVAFHRLGCALSEQAAQDLAMAEYRFDAAGARVVIVYRDAIDAVAESRTERGIPFDCVSDLDRALETAAGIDGSAATQGNVTFVVDRDGRVFYAHHSVTAFDIAPVDEVLNAVRTAAHTRAAN
jgi:peroxiredoxin